LEEIAVSDDVKRDAAGEGLGPEAGPPPTGGETAEGAGPGSGEQALEALRSELEEANRKGQEYLQLLQRVQADFINYRRRMEQERTEQAKYAKSDVLLKLLPALDDFDRALAAVPPDAAGSDWVQGIQIIRRKLQTLLDSEGVQRLETVGKPFDPWQHEAVMYEEAPGAEEGSVVEEFRPGYKLHDRIIRPAQVKVAKHTS
jgi:molecular chaperone GrpE